MQISVNGEMEIIEPQSLEGYLSDKSLLGRRIAVERNGDIVPKSQFSENKASMVRMKWPSPSIRRALNPSMCT